MVVMTDEQMEVLRKQIFIYFTICEQLVGMHRTLTSHQDSIAGMRLGNLYCDPLMVHGGHKITARQRWAPTQMQLQILESIFDQGNGTPRKQKIKDITAELSPAISQRLMSTTGSRTGVHGRSGRSLLSYQITLNWRLRRMRSPRPRRSLSQMDHFTRTFGRSFTSY